jgi:hypothetical protein
MDVQTGFKIFLATLNYTGYKTNKAGSIQDGFADTAD